MGEVGEEAGPGLERGDEGGPVLDVDLEGRAAVPTVEVAVLGDGRDVELLLPVRAVAVPDEAEFLEDGQGSVDRRRDRRRVDGAAAFDELGAGDVTPRRSKDLDEGAALGGPAEPPRPELLANLGPGWRASRVDRAGGRPCRLLGMAHPAPKIRQDAPPSNCKHLQQPWMPAILATVDVMAALIRLDLVRPSADPAMHLPDGFLSVPIALAMWALTLVAVGFAVHRANQRLDERAVPLMGVLAAFVFAAQMFNFQVIGGTSGHLLGGVLAGVLLGPWAGTLVMTAVVAVQALLFQDGGLVVMGANIFNMGVVGTMGGYALYRAFSVLLGGEERGRLPAAAVAAWASVVAGAGLTALQLGLSGTTPLELTLPAMLGVHALIGIGEAVITTGALAFIAVTRADLFAIRDSIASTTRATTSSGLSR